MKRYLLPMLLMLAAFLTNGQSKKRLPSVLSIGTGDTLTLFTRYSECGEWGGHHEYLRIYRDEVLIVAHAIDSVYCGREVEIKRFPFQTRLKTLTDSDIDVIEEYMKKVVKLSKEEQIYGSNANNGFYIFFREREFFYIDSSFTWDEFARMKREVFR